MTFPRWRDRFVRFRPRKDEYSQNKDARRRRASAPKAVALRPCVFARTIREIASFLKSLSARAALQSAHAAHRFVRKQLASVPYRFGIVQHPSDRACRKQSFRAIEIEFLSTRVRRMNDTSQPSFPRCRARQVAPDAGPNSIQVVCGLRTERWPDRGSPLRFRKSLPPPCSSPRPSVAPDLLWPNA